MLKKNTLKIRVTNVVPRLPARTKQVVPMGISVAKWYGSHFLLFCALRSVVPNKILSLAESQNICPRKNF